MPAYTPRERIVTLVAFALALAGQVYVVAVATWKAPVFAELFAGLGGELPFITEAFFATRPFWWLVPVGSALLALDVLRRRDPSLTYFTTAFVASAVGAFLLLMWMVEALYAPMLQILRNIG